MKTRRIVGAGLVLASALTLGVAGAANAANPPYIAYGPYPNATICQIDRSDYVRLYPNWRFYACTKYPEGWYFVTGPR